MVSKDIELKIWESNCVTLYAREGEIDSRYIKVSFKTQELKNLDLTGKTVTIYAKKPDGTQIFNTCTINSSDNTITAKLTSQFLSAKGIVECEFQIFEGDTVLLKVSGLKIMVVSVLDFSEAVESTSEYNTLLKSIEQAQDFANKTGDTKNLSTNDKSSIIAAINEVNAKTIPVSQGGTGGTTATAARTNLEVMKAYVLYDNDEGNEGTVTLNQSADGFNFIDIILWDFYLTRIYSGNNRPVGIMKIGGYGGNYFEWFSESLTISNQTITRNGVTHGIISEDGTVTIDNTNHLPIRAVIGYKY